MTKSIISFVLLVGCLAILITIINEFCPPRMIVPVSIFTGMVVATVLLNHNQND